MRGVRLRSFDGDTPSLSGQAREAAYERNGELTASHATLQVPGRTPADLTTVSAERMEGNVGTRHLVASGDVVVRTGAGLVARTPRATYDGTTQVAQGEEGVDVQAPDYRLRADTFSLSVPEGTFTFEGSVRTVLEGAR
jgi:lipopolysaccharide export system protein LptC